MATENFTTYTETDPNSRIAVTAATITGTGLARNEAAHVEIYKGADYFTGVRARVRTKANNASGSGAEIGILGMTDGAAAYTSWTSGILLKWINDGSYKLQIINLTTDTADTSSALSADTMYYIEFRRHGLILKAYIYSDDLYETIVDTLTITDLTDSDRWTDCYALVTENSANTQTMDVTVQNLELFMFSIAQYSNPIRALQGTLDEDFETTGAGTAVTALPRNEDAYISKDYGADYFDALDEHFSLKIGSATETAGRVGYAFSNTLNDTNSFDTLDIYAAALRNGESIWSIYLIRGAFIAYSQASTATHGITEETLYYCHLERAAGNDTATLKLYSDEVETTQIGTTLSVSGFSAAKWRYHLPVVSHNSGSAAAFTGTVVSDRDLSDYTETDPNSRFAVADFANWTESEPSGTTMERSITDPIAGSYSLYMAGKSDGTAFPSLAKVFTPATNNSWQVTRKVKISTIADGHYLPIGAMKRASNGRWVGAYIKRSGIVYTWGIATYDGTTIVKTDSTHRATVGTIYDVNLIGDKVGSFVTASLNIEGVCVCAVDTSAFLDGVYVDTEVIGYYGNIGSVYSAMYLDDDYLLVGGLFRFNNMSDRSEGGLIAALGFKSAHEGVGPMKVVIADNPVSEWTLEETLDENPTYGTGAIAGMVRNGDDITVYDQKNNEGDGTRYFYKRTTGPVAWALDDTEGPELFYSSRMVEGGYVLGVQSGWDATVQTRYYAKYNLTTKAFTVVSTIYTTEDIAGRRATEVQLFRHPVDNRLGAMIRLDATSGPTAPYLAVKYSEDDGATWGAITSLFSLWGYKSSMPVVVPVGDRLWVSTRAEPTNLVTANSQNVIMIIDPDTFEIENEFRFSYTSIIDEERGNGDILYLSADYPYIHMMFNSGTAGYYKILVPSPPRMESVAVIDSTTIDVVFNTPMDETSVETLTNWELDQSAIFVANPATATLQGDGVTVRLTFVSTFNGTYTIFASQSITDTAGRSVSEDYDELEFTHSMANCQSQFNGLFNGAFGGAFN